MTVQLKPLKPSASTPAYTLSSQPANTSIFDLKTAYASQHSLDAAKLKLLRNKKPVADSKSLHDVLADGGEAEKNATVEFSIMVMPGAVLEKKAAVDDKMDVDAAPVAQGPSGAEVLGGEEFWTDLRGFLLQRIRDEGESEKLVGVFRNAWESSVAKP